MIGMKVSSKTADCLRLLYSSAHVAGLELSRETLEKGTHHNREISSREGQGMVIENTLPRERVLGTVPLGGEGGTVPELTCPPKTIPVIIS